MTTKVNKRMVEPEAYTIATLSEKGSAPNLNKWIGKQVFITDNNKAAFSQGVADVSPWGDAQGVVLATPV